MLSMVSTAASNMQFLALKGIASANLYMLDANVGQNTANTIKSVANNLQIAALVGFGASIMWGAGLFGLGGEEGARSAKKRWTRAAIGIVVCVAAWFLLSWLKGYATTNFPDQ
ncbi:hypothetical protein [Ligilactobacillus salivarius]|uniref:hypothetical protein n=1 Tax=Ligilactobacillus salivarius TaxID=1624 RepID=UPI001CBE2428|nr:hypothetical protein [Ligilactobacillus salivarius]MBZ4030184.1 hypothetical protein [Ligilactobacillus salivarius]MDM8283377.1 hypothetical protein [Ligilactobacillus salivarius]